MIAIPMYELQKLTLALPRCLICQPNDAGCSWIIDKDGGKVGDINWHIPQIMIYEGYEYADEVIEAIGKEKFQIREVEFDHEWSKESIALQQQIDQLPEANPNTQTDQ